MREAGRRFELRLGTWVVGFVGSVFAFFCVNLAMLPIRGDHGLSTSEAFVGFVIVAGLNFALGRRFRRWRFGRALRQCTFCELPRR